MSLVQSVSIMLSICASVKVDHMGTQEVWQSIEAAAVAAEPADKDLLLIFTGTEWCYPCKLLEESVFANPELREQIEEEFVIVRFELRAPDAPNEIARESAFRDEISTKWGAFGVPRLLMTDRAGLPFEAIQGFGKSIDPAEFTARVVRSRDNRVARDRHFMLAHESTGLKRAQGLFDALATIAPELVARHYEDVLMEIEALNVQDQLGLNNDILAWRALYQAQTMNSSRESYNQNLWMTE